ncbi:hypothetical protein NDU88_003130, partial [Pleurodeles waltl]
VLWSLENGRWIPEEPYELSSHFPAAPAYVVKAQLRIIRVLHFNRDVAKTIYNS